MRNSECRKNYITRYEIKSMFHFVKEFQTVCFHFHILQGRKLAVTVEFLICTSKNFLGKLIKNFSPSLTFFINAAIKMSWISESILYVPSELQRNIPVPLCTISNSESLWICQWINGILLMERIIRRMHHRTEACSHAQSCHVFILVLHVGYFF